MTAILPTTTDFFCTDVSTNMGEAQHGTAVTATIWFILEVRGGWPAQAPADNDLPQPVQDWLNTQVEGVENGRLQFIRGEKNETGPLTFFIAQTGEQHQAVYRFALESYEDLLQMDVTAVLAHDPTYAAHQWRDPLVLVCTHGRRDRCCAKFGLPVYNTLRAGLGGAVWQTTHTGGHRFAPTLLTFPDGTSYGRFTLEDISQLTQAINNRHLFPDKLRGRCCYTAVAQVADYFLRQETEVLDLDAFQHLSTQTINENQWLITFSQPEVHQTHKLTIEAAEPLQLYASSGSFKLKTVSQFQLVSYEVGNMALLRRNLG